MTQETRTLAELAALVEGELLGDPGVRIAAFNDVANASAGEITFIAQGKYVDQLERSKASAVIVPQNIQEVALPAIRVKNPYLAAAMIHNLFYKRPLPAPGIDKHAVIGADCRIAPSVSIAPLAVVGRRVTLGENVVIESGVVIGEDVIIGDGTILEANVVVRAGCRIGRRVILYSGAVIGSDGFGYATNSRGIHIKRPQVGNVVLEDDVEIGANTCIDRATFGSTVIGKGTKIDNLVQIGHNAEVGEGCLMVSQSGLAGSCKLGNGVVLAGQSGVGDHVEVGDGVMAAGRSGINSNVKPGSVVAGFPAIAYKEWLQAATAFSRIPQLLKDVRRLRKQVSELAGDGKNKETGDE
ncbi:MAG: UDP-3-O-(3-hydroxymyristoyl)glucosamine N-acyltransferase [Proteobacteria bacterium]|nr:UDP-3-O-(3-hydroxymyristoyl)glucosamine N-acyltransferase [Pseudomonadota bacterium]MBU0966390.1 UDP-3-O-(3-hydroxymyristoyl)glucosamine N-acyltransferase [Pseudomonadota bacterium]